MTARDPEECTTMAEGREGVDEVDRQLVALLDRRFGYMRAAARIKPTRDAVRDEARKADVIEAVRRDAEARGLPVDALTGLFNSLVETSIAYEMVEWDRLSNTSDTE